MPKMNGIEFIDEVPWGTHLCQFYQSKEDLIEILVPYFKQGLENNEFCMWVTSEPLGVEDAKTALKEKVKNLDDYIRKGQIEILDYKQWYTATGRFEADKVLEGWVEKEKQAIEKGFDGLRLTGNTFWLEKKDWQSFADYEAVVNSVIGKHRMLAICSYSLDRCQAGEVIDVVNNHQFALIRKEGKWTTLESSERKRAQVKLQQHIKQLNCLYGLSRLAVQPQISLDQIFQETTGLIRSSYQYPDITCVRITFNGIQYKTDNFQKSELSQHADIRVRGEKAGSIEVYCLQERQENGEGPFLKEEGTLLNAVCEKLGRIAELKQATDKLQIFRNLIEQSNDCIFVLEPQWGRFLDVNDRACQSLRYSRKELLEMSIKDVEEFSDDSPWQQQADELKLKGDIIRQTRYRRKDGTAFFVEASLKLVSQEKEDFIIAVARDITERKQMEEKLRVSEHKYKTLLENLPQKIFYKDKNSVYISCNENYASDIEIKPEEIAGKTDYDFYPKDLAEKYRADDRRIMESGKSEDIEEKYIQDGQETVVYTVKTPVKDEQKNVVGILGIFWDIMERKRAEEKQAELLKEVESTNRELKDFAYIVSHDLKAPLRGVKTLAEWISTDYADKLGEQGKEQIRLLMGRADRMQKLIDGVLQYSRVGRVKENRVVMDLNKVVAEVVDMIAPPENITITIENQLPTIECEPTRIAQVFQNLLSNAVKYMDKPQGLIKVACVEENPPEAGLQAGLRPVWKFSVSDNGPGIEEKHFEKIFQIFQILAPRDDFESTGVGLTVAKKIVELYGGRIWVQSKVGQGSTFFFTLPKQEVGVGCAKLEANITC